MTTHIEPTVSSCMNIDTISTSFQESKQFIVELINCLDNFYTLYSGSEELDRGNERDGAGEYSLIKQSSCSSKEYEIVSSILLKNEQESKKLKRYYEERLKDVSEERDQLMRDVLESRFKIESQKNLIEQIKTKNMELEETVKSIIKDKEDMAAQLRKKEGEGKEFLTNYDILQKEVVNVKRFSSQLLENVQTVKSFHSEIVSLNSKLERALDKKTLQTTSLKNENSRLKVQSSQLQSEIEEHKSTIVEKNNHIQLLNEQYSEKELIWRSRVLNKEELETSLEAAQSLLQQSMERSILKEKEIQVLQDQYSLLLEQSKQREHSISQNQSLEMINVAKTQNVYEAQLSDLQQQILSLRSQIQDLSKELDQAKRVAEESSNECNKYQELLELKDSEYENMKRDNEQIRSEKNHIEIDVSRCLTNLKELQESYDSLKEENRVLLSAKNQCVEEVLRLQVMLEESKKEMDSKQEAINTSTPATSPALNDYISATTRKNVPVSKTESQHHFVTQNTDNTKLSPERLRSSPGTGQPQVPQIRTCGSCGKKPFGLMISCITCEKKFHATCLSPSSTIGLYECESCNPTTASTRQDQSPVSSDPLNNLKRKPSGIKENSKRKLKRVSFSNELGG